MPEERVGDHIINKMPLNRFVRSKGRYFEGVMHNDIPESIILGFGEDRNSRIVMQYVLQADTLEPLFGNLAVLTKSMAGYIYVKIDLDHIQENMERDHNH